MSQSSCYVFPQEVDFNMKEIPDRRLISFDFWVFVILECLLNKIMEPIKCNYLTKTWMESFFVHGCVKVNATHLDDI